MSGRPKAPGTLRTCPKGHAFFKTSDCPTCPTCEAASRRHDAVERRNPVKAAGDFLSKLGAPAYRALKNAGWLTLRELSKHSEAELLKLHGMGPASLPKLRAALKDEGLAFRDDTAATQKTTSKTKSKTSSKASRKAAR